MLGDTRGVSATDYPVGGRLSHFSTNCLQVDQGPSLLRSPMEIFRSCSDGTESCFKRPSSRPPGRRDAKEVCGRTLSRTPIQSKDIHGPETRWQTKANFRCVSPQQGHCRETIQPAFCLGPESLAPSIGFHGKDRPNRSLLAHPDPSLLSQVPGFPFSGQGLPVQGHALRPVCSPHRLHGGHEASLQAAQGEGPFGPELPRRLDCLGQLLPSVRAGGSGPPIHPGRDRIPGEQGEVPLGTNPVLGLARYPLGYMDAVLEPSLFLSGKTHFEGERALPCLGSVKETDRVPSRLHGFPRPMAPRGKVGLLPLSPCSGSFSAFQGHYGPLSATSESRSGLVARGSEPYPSSCSKASEGLNLALDRCLGRGLGGSHRRRDISVGSVEHVRVNPAHQSKGDQGSSPGASPAEPSLLQKDCRLGRQRDRCLRSEILGLQEVPLSSHRSETTSRSLPVEELVVRGSENSISVECPSRRSLQGLSSSVRVVPSSSLQGPSLCLGRDSGRRPLGDSVQSATSSVCLPLPPSRGECSGRAGSELERLGFPVPVSSSGPVGEISSPSRHVLREGYPNPQSQPVVPSLVSVGEEAPSEPAITGATGSVREGCLGARRVGEIVAMDCHSFLSSSLSSSLNPRVARWVINGRRSSSRRQREVAWNQLRLFLADVPESQPFSKTLALEFLISCLEDKGLRSSTVRAYRNSLALPLRLAGVELSEWEFEEVLRAGFIANPPASKRFPSWNLGKVLDSLRNHPQNDLEFLEKTLFLTALASGNRVSELAALRADTVRFTEEGVYLAVKPGFLYKNQKEGRTPPNIFIPSLPSDPALCPVRWLRRYVERFHKVSGSLFTNTRSGAALSAASIASLLCRTIDRADPGTLPRSHDIRRKATSLAWVWGVPPLEICRRGFWASSSAFIQRYLDSSILETSGVALGSLPPS